MTDSIVAPWEELLPANRGSLPLGGQLVRTDPSGPTPARIAIVGLYPALTRTKRYASSDGPRLLPVEVESHSFEGSRSAAEIHAKYLAPLKLDRKQVFFIDLYPYYLANARVGKNKRTMWDNVVTYKRETKKKVAVQCRPSDDEMVKLCSALPGNKERLADYFGRCKPRLVITLGNEVAAFARGLRSATKAQEYLYDPSPTPDYTNAFGPNHLRVVHCAHPGILMSPQGAEWNRKHAEWCAGEGAALVAGALGN